MQMGSNTYDSPPDRPSVPVRVAKYGQAVPDAAAVGAEQPGSDIRQPDLSLHWPIHKVHSPRTDCRRFVAVPGRGHHDVIVPISVAVADADDVSARPAT